MASASCQTGCSVLRFSQIKTELIQKSTPGHYIQSVPFVRQKKNWCGPAALASVLNYWGMDVSQEELASQIYISSLRGTLDFELKQAAFERGFWSQDNIGSLNLLFEFVDRDYPVITLNKSLPIFSVYHYNVVIGYDDWRNVIIAHAGEKENKLIYYRTFLRGWKPTDNWLLVVCPPEKVDWKLSFDGYNQLGLLFEKKDKLEPAKENYKKAIEENPDSAVAYFNLGNCFLKQDLYKEAERNFKKAIELNQKFADALNNLAYLYIKANYNLKEAGQLIEKAIETASINKSHYLDTQGLLGLRLNKTKEAINTFFEAAKNTDRPDTKSIIIYHLGIAYLKEGNEKLAERNFAEAKKLNSDLKENDFDWIK